MKFLRAGKNGFVFRINPREKEFLVATLKMFPILDSGHHQISKSAAGKAEQQLLEEAMDQQRVDNKKKLDAFFADEHRFVKDSSGQLLLTIAPEQSDWLLQVLNDVRVGSWVKLGRPELEQARKLALTREKARYFAAMEMSGYFQMALLEAFKKT